MKMKIINDKLFFYVDSAMKIADFFAYYYLSKKTIHDLLTNRLLVNHNQVNNDYMLRKGDVISVDIAKTIDKKVSGNLCDVIYEDDIVLIVKKGDDQIIHDDQSDNALENDFFLSSSSFFFSFLFSSLSFLSFCFREALSIFPLTWVLCCCIL